MSWSQWTQPAVVPPQPAVVATQSSVVAAPPLPGVTNAAQSVVNPTGGVINSAPAVLPPGLQYTPEQWAQIQQQNWQQWAQWQQQYQQWQQQYGAEFQKSMSALSANATTAATATAYASTVPPLPTDVKPPLPPEDPPSAQQNIVGNPGQQFNMFTMPPPTHTTGYNTTSMSVPPPKFAAPSNPQIPPPSNTQNLPGVQTKPEQNWQNYSNNQYSQPPPVSNAQNPDNLQQNKRPMSQQNEYYNNTKRNRYEQNADWQQAQQQPHKQNFGGYPHKPNIEELSEAEKKFDKEFAAWEAQFNKWKEQNAGHPDKEQYREYEKKWEEWRAKLLERREQMRKKRLSLCANSSVKPPITPENPPYRPPQMGAIQQKPPPINPPGNFAKPPPINEPKFEKTDVGMEPPPNEENQGGFLSSKTTTTDGIPGLDLVKEDAGDEEKEQGMKMDKAETKKNFDFDALSKNISSILGDQKLLTMLSQVSQNQNLNVAAPKVQPDDRDVSFMHSTNSHQSEPSNLDDSYSNQREGININNFDDQTRSSFTGQVDQHYDKQPGDNSNISNMSNNAIQGKFKSGDNNYGRNFQESGEFGGGNRGNAYGRFDQIQNPDDNFNNYDCGDGFGRNDNFSRKEHFDRNDGFGRSDNVSRSDNFGRNDNPVRDDNLGRKNSFGRNDNFSQSDRFGRNDMFDRGDNFDRCDNSDRTAGNFGRTPPNFNRGNNFNRDNFNRGPGFNRGNFNRDNFDFNRGDRHPNIDDCNKSDEFNRRPGFNSGNDFNRAPNSLNRGGFNSISRAPNFDRENALFNRGDRGQDDFNKGDNFTGGNFNRRDPYNRRDNFNRDSVMDDMNENVPKRNDDYQEDRNFNKIETADFNSDTNASFGFESVPSNNFGDDQNSRFSNEFPETIPPDNTDPYVEPKKPVDDMLKPSVVIEYDHKSKRPPEFDVSIEPIQTFDYRHKPVNRIPLPQRPKWLNEAVKNFREFDPLSGRPYDNLRRYPSAERYDTYRGDKRKSYDDRPYNKRYDEKWRHDRDYERTDSYGKQYDYEPTIKHERGFSPRYDDYERNYDSRKDDHEKNYDSRRNFEVAPKRDNFEKHTGDYDTVFESTPKEDLGEDLQTNKNEDETINEDKFVQQTTPRITLIEDLLDPPERFKRPPRIVIILRGPPGSGKTYLAKLIKDKEVENGGSAPRILSLDDYFMVEQEKEIVEDGKRVKIKDMVYEYEESMEATYRASLLKSFKKTVTDGLFSFIIVDNVNEKVKYFGEMWSFAKQNGFQVYVCQMELDVQSCTKRNIHGRTEEDIQKCVSGWEQTPAHHPTLDATSLIQSASIPDVEMEEINSPASEEYDGKEEDQAYRSKWDNFECSVDNLAKLDGISKPLRPSRTMEDYLQLEEWTATLPAKPGQKRVRWADLEERKEQEKMRAIGFVVGQTDWNRMMDPTMGGSALTQTKYIERVRRY